MARYRIHRIRESMKEQFRWLAHTGGTAIAKPKDYEVGGEYDAATPYALWMSLKADGNALCHGDVLEIVREDGTQGDLQIFKYIGFEPAKWWIPEPKPDFKNKVDGLPEPTSAAATESQPG